MELTTELHTAYVAVVSLLDPRQAIRNIDILKLALHKIFDCIEIFIDNVCRDIYREFEQVLHKAWRMGSYPF